MKLSGAFLDDVLMTLLWAAKMGYIEYDLRMLAQQFPFKEASYGEVWAYVDKLARDRRKLLNTGVRPRLRVNP